MANALKKAIVDWVFAEAGLAAIFAKQDGPRPALPYVVVDFESVDSAMYEDARYTAQDGIFDMVVSSTVTFSVLCCGPSAKKSASQLALSLRKDSVRAAFRAVGWAYSAMTPLQDVSVVRDSVWERQTVFEILFLTDLGQALGEDLSTTQDLSWIENADVSGTIT